MKMKRYAILMLAVFALAMAWHNGQCTAKTPEEIAKDIAPLISENTVCVVHVDITTLDPEQVAKSLKELCNVVRNAAAFDEKLAKEVDRGTPPDRVFDEAPKEGAEALKFIRENCGVTEFYYIVSFPFNDCIVVPIREGVKTEFFDERTFVEWNGFMLAPSMRNFRYADSDQRGQVERMFGKGFTPTERPEIVEGLKLAGDKPVRAVAFWPSYAKMLMTQIGPEFQEPFNTISSEQVFDGLQFIAAGFEPNLMQAELIIKSKDQNAAEAFRELILSLPDKLTQLITESQSGMQHSAFAHFSVSVLIAMNSFRDNADFLFPPPKDGLITIHLPGDAFPTNLAKLFESVLTESRTGTMSFASHSKTCADKMKWIMLAMHTYHDPYRHFPQAYTLDAEDKPLHSWRVALLPYLEQAKLYEQIRRDEPWDSEWNRQFHNQCPEIFQCPTMSDEEKAAGLTSYSLVVGTRCYPKPSKRPYDIRQITDGTSNTICIVERKTPVNWMDPTAELTQEQAFLGPADPESGIGLRHETEGKKTFNVGLFDGSVHVIGEDIPLETWKALLTRAGGESVSY